MSLRWIAVPLTIVAFSAFAKEPPSHRGHDRKIPDSPVVTPWAIPLAGGAISVLFVAPQCTLRDVVELTERLEIEPEIVPLDSVTGPGLADQGADIFHVLDRPHDVFVLGNLDPSALPEGAWDRIIEQTSAGCGLVLANLRGDAPLRLREILATTMSGRTDASTVTRGIGEALTPEWPSSLSFVKTAPHGQGRVVFLDYPGERPSTHFLIPGLSDPGHARPEFFETYLSLVARAIRWAAGRDPSLWVTGVENAGPKGPQESEIPPDLPEEYIQAIRDGVSRPLFETFLAHLNHPAEKAYRVHARVRRPDRGISISFPDMPDLARGADSYSVNLHIGPGKALLDLWFSEGKRIAEWHTEVIEIRGWPDIADVSYSKGALLPNDTLSISLTVRPDYARPRPCTIYARAVDSLNRKVAESSQIMPPEGGQAHITLAFADLIANMVKVELFAADLPKPRLARWELDRARYSAVCLPVRAPRPLNDLSFVVENPVPTEYNARTFMRTLAGLGIDSALVPPTIEARFFLAEANLRPIPELVHFTSDAIEDGNVRKPCLSETTYRDAQLQKLRDEVPGFWAVGTTIYSLGNGNCLTDGPENVCQSPTCIDGFRTILREQYGDLSSLADAWARPYETWDTVAPISFEDTVASGVFAPWLDFRLFMDRTFCNAHVFARDAVRSVDRGARVGFCAVPGEQATLGYDWSLLASELDAIVVPPDPLTIEKIRSYRPRNAYSAVMADAGGTLTSAPFAGWLPWYQVLHGFHGCWLPQPYGSVGVASSSAHASQAAMIGPDGRPSDALREMADSLSTLRSGLGALLLNAVRDDAKIALYDSQTSHYFTQANAGLGFRTAASQTTAIRLLESAGYSYDFVSKTQLLGGRLGKYALVILPGVIALSEQEVDALRCYSAEGGHVVADVLPGQYDDHGVRRTVPALDDIFGVKAREPGPTSSPGREGVEVPVNEDSRLILPGSVQAVASIEVATGTAGGRAGDFPLWVTKGGPASTNVLLNHSFPSYPLSPEQDRPFRTLFGEILNRTGLTPSFPVSTSGGVCFVGECLSLRYGKADLIAFLNDPSAEKEAVKLLVPCDKQKWLYDLNHPGRPAHKGEIRVKLAPGEVAIFSLLPYEVKEVSVITLDRIEAGKRLPIRLLIKARGALPDKHLVSITIVHGTRSKISHYETNVTCLSGEGRTFVPLALDEPTGIYTIEAKDVLSGISGRTYVWVDPALGS